ncbi:hypothetical protein [Mycobacterium palustre]|uniref:Integral membrane protein n=1 Tax=Mycobacterium palustre TaxID=153971 RepID=A0A1X1ZV91_9MYCO|nr:hypothetical protein [Mycobacterium palustre]MCV7099210.1 hypothetical protein [Mycobacterium palustre]ORW27926.1 hypothetical protein AWC19_01840 [Mycobacterium palustre]
MRSVALVASTVFGVLMVGLAAVGAHGVALAAAAAALIAVGAGVVYRPAATGAVLLCVAAILASDPSLVLAAWSGLCAAAYLACCHAVGAAEGVVMRSWPTVLGAVGFTVAGLVATAFPLQLPWLPLAAPLAALAVYLVATRPFVS